jgi:hypothetical protein
MTVQPDVSYLFREDPPPRYPIFFSYGRPQRGLLKGTAPVTHVSTWNGANGSVWEARAPRYPTPTAVIVVRAGRWVVHVFLKDPEDATDVARALAVCSTRDGYPFLTARHPIALSDEYGEGGGAQLSLGDSAAAPNTVRARGFRFVQLAPLSRCGRVRRELSPSGRFASMCLKPKRESGALYVGINGTSGFVRAVFEGLELERLGRARGV